MEYDPKHQLVTFLWRGNANTRNVVVFCSCQMTSAVPQDSAMHRLAETDVWYLTLWLPMGGRFAYQLSPNDPLRFDGPQPQRQATTLRILLL